MEQEGKRMKRLTIRNSNGSVSQPTDLNWAEALEKLADYEDAEEQGRLVMLPCKVGDTIYILGGDVKNGYETVKKTHVEEVPFGLGCLNKQMKLYPFYYLSRKEAEKALKEEKDDVDIH